MFNNKICIWLVACILMGCASAYRPVMPNRISYKESFEDNGLKLQYRYNILKEAGNKKYAAKESRSGIRLVAVEFTNNSEQTVTFGQNVGVFSGNRELVPLKPEEVRREIRQVAGLYMIWSAFWIVINNCDNDDCTSIPLPVGALIGLGNMSAAKAANRNMLHDLRRYDLSGKTIGPGETVYGILPLAVIEGDVLEVHLK
ncbi:MAG: hypothetical protein ACOYXT_05510 [Bacteroidota bacterium]